MISCPKLHANSKWTLNIIRIYFGNALQLYQYMKQSLMIIIKVIARKVIKAYPLQTRKPLLAASFPSNIYLCKKKI